MKMKKSQPDTRPAPDAYVDLKPYYSDRHVALYHCDNREWYLNYMRNYTDHRHLFDLILTDPPYNEVNRHSNGLARLDRGEADSLEVDIEWYADKFWQLSTGSIYVWCGMRQLSRWLDEFVELGMSVRGGVWHKTNVIPMNAQHLWTSGLEAVAFARHPSAYFDHPVSPLYFHGPTHPMTDVHPTAKPLWLFSEIISASCRPGGVVLDPFAGIGTTLEAAKKLGRRAVGIELKEEYCDVAARRLSQGVLF
jgi:site-specific DNA-methyltransferase (adenine-specific)